MIVLDLSSVVRCGRIDLEETWEKYMVTGRFTRTSTESEFPKASSQAKELYDLLHKWCDGSVIGWSRIQNDWEGWARSMCKNKEIYSLDVNQETVSLAIDFHTFTMAWKSSLVYDSIAYALVHFKIMSDWPKGGNMLVERLSKTCNLKIFYKKDFYQRVIKMLKLTEPYRQEPIKPEGLQESHAALLNQFIFVAQMIQEPSINEETFSRFWKNLDVVARRNRLTFMNDFKKICFYFSKGRPFDNSFEYFKLLSE
ncbi:hypothetical protein PGT21_014828 [Puccinia graminis f. sp. tritici]|nr:hypothetical protein PGT21_014828 [Puccinia graminis f. sp. tritici]